MKGQKKTLLDSQYQELQGSNLKTEADITNIDISIWELMKAVQKLTNKQELHDQIILKAGLQQIIKIKEGWSKYKSDPILYDYQKTFYWTLVDYFNAYRIANTGVVQIRTGHIESPEQKVAAKATFIVLKIGNKLVSGFPQAGSVFSAIDKVLEFAYEQIKLKNYKDRVNAITNIIHQNHDPDAQSVEDFNNALALAALEIVDRKYEENSGVSQQDDQIKKKNYFAEFIHKIQEFALSEKIELYSTQGGKEALKDVLLLLLDLTLNHEEIIRMSGEKKLHLIITDSVMLKKSSMLLAELPQTENEVKANDKKKKLYTKCQIM